jgi:hypothetical protein
VSDRHDRVLVARSGSRASPALRTRRPKLPEGRRDDELQQQLRQRIRQLRDRALLKNASLQVALEETGVWQGQVERVLHDRSRALTLDLLEALDRVFAPRLPAYPPGALLRQARGGGPDELDAFAAGSRSGSTAREQVTAPTREEAPRSSATSTEEIRPGGATSLPVDDSRAADEVSLGLVDEEDTDLGWQDDGLKPDSDGCRKLVDGGDPIDDRTRETAAASTEGVRAAPRRPGRGMLTTAAVAIGTVTAVVGLNYWWWLHPASANVIGTVRCASGSDVQGIWVRTRSDRLSGWAELSRRSTSSTRFRARVPVEEPYKVHVGCTGTGDVWLDNRSEYVMGTNHTFVCYDDEVWVTRSPYHGPCRVQDPTANRPA